MHITLEKNAKYQATINLNAIEAFADNKFISKKLTDYGFADVMVTGLGKSRQAVGIWAKENITGPAPTQVTEIQKL